jgi:endonuclease III related protein
MSKPIFIEALNIAYSLMRARFWNLHWWPADDSFEVCVGAILTQKTHWKNVEKAIRALKKAGCMNPASMHKVNESDLATWIRSVGYFNVKARHLKAFVHVLIEEFNGGVAAMLEGETAVARERLLNIKGIGPETADCMLLYAGGRNSFIVNAYTGQIFLRHGWSPDAVSSNDLKSICETHISLNKPQDLLDYWQHYYTQLVVIDKTSFRPRIPNCIKSPLVTLLPAV